jgi:hypothetical protein
MHFLHVCNNVRNSFTVQPATMLLQQTRAFTASRAGRARTATAVKCQAQRDHSFVQQTAAVAAAMLILVSCPDMVFHAKAQATAARSIGN